jgi:hypothetical protein
MMSIKSLSAVFHRILSFCIFLSLSSRLRFYCLDMVGVFIYSSTCGLWIRINYVFLISVRVFISTCGSLCRYWIPTIRCMTSCGCRMLLNVLRLHLIDFPRTIYCRWRDNRHWLLSSLVLIPRRCSIVLICSIIKHLWAYLAPNACFITSTVMLFSMSSAS